MQQEKKKAENTSSKKSTSWHQQQIDEVFYNLHTSKEGLSPDEAEQRLNEHGENKLPESEPPSALKRFLMQFHNVLIYVLIAAAGITALLDHWLDTGVILGVVLINAIIGYVQEGKAEKALEGIRNMLSLDATVLRNGQRRKIDAELLVPGDIVLLESGDKIPADLRLIDVRNLRIEESALTGESVAVEKHTEEVEEDAVPGDRKNMAFSGTSVVYGRATGVVVETGSHTQLGQINRMMTDVEKITTPLLRQIDQFGKVLSVGILGLTAIFFAIGYFFRDYEISELFMAVISLAVAAIPEGLPAIMTITLAIGVQAMARRNAIIRKLPSVETLGSVSVICSDKTGTLTRNEMTTRSVITADAEYEVEGAGYEPEGDLIKNGEKIEASQEPVLQKLIETVIACSDSQIHKEDDQWKLEGDPTEGALVTLAHKTGFGKFNPDRVDHIPFESEHQFMATLNENNGKRIVYVKGAPERLLERCDAQLTADGREDLDTEFWREMSEKQAGQGRRLIAAAYAETDQDVDGIDHDDIQGLTFLGIAGIVDPPRPEAIEAIKACKSAGIRVKMITGDHLVTASAIGLELGLSDGTKAISGAELEAMNDQEIRKAALEYDVFARTSPEHKLRLVKALQEENLICAMTGDGVNDAPALKRADVGIAMGIKGTEVTKDSAEMVLADDNFASIANAVEEGRTIYDNLKKAILFIIPTNGAESLVIMAAVLMGLVLPITPVQILWVNMVTAVTLALALSFEPTEPGVMKRPPRDSGDAILSGYLIWRIAFVSVLIGGLTLGMYYWLKQNGYDVETARTIAVNTLVAGQLFYLFNCRRMHGPAIDSGFFDNRAVFYTTGLLIFFQFLFTYAPFMNTLFGTDPHELSYWIFPLAAGVIVFLTVELEKLIFGRRQKAKQKMNS
ncbi:cation-transporting P-type ATPase [Rhodohalobacter sp. SW132]|uniref:cation-transporting P-type ATPase n=1 Tax=Rhodohalobacter sp. SW132 TaxID=2293433 RepID=UPI000E23C378|nr:cation-transporting P-type ATPase [Rhodohalobacter sp. SW132]REL24051.1 cation-transporting P-type ATPase [Rhodohalobacter sp. SW132]